MSGTKPLRRLIDIRLISAEGRHRILCLGTDAVQLQCRGAETIVTLVEPVARARLVPPRRSAATPTCPRPDSRLAPNRRWTGTSSEWTTSAAPVPDFETEPNDDPAVATAFDPSIVMRGRGATGDPDMFRVTVSGRAAALEGGGHGAGDREPRVDPRRRHVPRRRQAGCGRGARQRHGPVPRARRALAARRECR